MKKRAVLILAFILFILLFASPAFAQTTYIVQRGDSIWKIAVKYQVGMSEIIAANPQIKNPNLIYPGQKITIPSVPTSTQENEVAKLVNAERARAGLPALKVNWQLSRVARYKSADMANKGYFSHQSPTYGTPFQMMENLAFAFRPPVKTLRMDKEHRRSHEDWMNSPGHRNNILSRSYTEIGVGLAKNKNGVCYWTQMFMKPM